MKKLFLTLIFILTIIGASASKMEIDTIDNEVTVEYYLDDSINVAYGDTIRPIENVAAVSRTDKVIENGQVLIIRDGVTYTINGTIWR